MARQAYRTPPEGKAILPISICRMLDAAGSPFRLFVGLVLCSVGIGPVGTFDVAMAMPEASLIASGEVLSHDTFSVTDTTSEAVVRIISTRKAKEQEEKDIVESNQHHQFDDPFIHEYFSDQFSKPILNPRPLRKKFKSSGVIVSSDGYIVTNNDVIEGADQVTVVLADRRSFEAKVIGSDPTIDVALIKISAMNLQTVPWGDPSKLRVGEEVLAIGRESSLSRTVARGIISAVGPDHIRIVDYNDFSQMDPATNPGNSGGALVNLDGNLIGINTAISSQGDSYSGIWFAIPSNMVKSVTNNLEKHGNVFRSLFGVSVENLNENLAKEFGATNTKGALVDDVAVDGPADKAGLQRGDIIVAVDGVPVEEPGRLLVVEMDKEPGTTVALSVWRENAIRELAVTLGEPPNAVRGETKESDKKALTGVTVKSLTAEDSGRLHISSGVVVIKVDPNSPAERADIRPNDGILELNRIPIQSVLDFERLAQAVPPDSRVLLLIAREREKTFRSVAPE